MLKIKIKAITCAVLLLGRKHGLQNVSQCEQQLNDILLSYLEKKEEELKNAK